MPPSRTNHSTRLPFPSEPLSARKWIFESLWTAFYNYAYFLSSFGKVFRLVVESLLKPTRKSILGIILEILRLYSIPEGLRSRKERTRKGMGIHWWQENVTVKYSRNITTSYSLWARWRNIETPCKLLLSDYNCGPLLRECLRLYVQSQEMHGISIKYHRLMHNGWFYIIDVFWFQSHSLALVYPSFSLHSTTAVFVPSTLKIVISLSKR